MPGDSKRDPSLDLNFVRGHFPPLARGWALFENAGGTLAAQPVIDRLQAYMTDTMVQPGGPFDQSEEAAERIAESQRAVAALVNADPEEVMIGPSTTMNAYLLSHALRPLWKEGDEIVVTDLDHEANNGAWRRLAETGLVIREWRVDPETAELDPADLAKLLNDRTRLVAVSHCSNIAGGLNDVAALARQVHEAGALICVDGVAYAPHRRIDVRAWDVDFYLCSLYKLYGPHLGLLYGKREHLLRAKSQNHYFIGEDEIPLKLNPGGVNHELTASLAGVLHYFDALHDHHFGTGNQLQAERLDRVFGLIARHEEELLQPFMDFLLSKPGVRVIGRQTADRKSRVPTVAFTVKGKDITSIPEAVRPKQVAIRADDFYAARLIDALGLREGGGVVRAGMVHYNTPDEVGRLIAALDPLL